MGNKGADVVMLKRMWDIICEHPGVTVNDISKVTGLAYGSVIARLATMNNHGYMISESSNAGLYPFYEKHWSLDESWT